MQLKNICLSRLYFAHFIHRFSYIMDSKQMRDVLYPFITVYSIAHESEYFDATQKIRICK